ncbi:membrane protein DedA with SNARE-associated domain [Curtobacterium luteum]|uniref:Membrane protein DedA with SNARE-associated domain n=1 Tax=Curtobacterium luteum TaxID=33881 RepID=A0A8H9G737_9MICO|nr:hypothetical protein [Curtobacterium luteum]MBM7801556.1 membrane protein DedA with SNARE-associated domain [Curtobacterium luteum]NUU52118.1 hypothetical protein [Curtobacterium luteum]GGK89561.1 hypothetical protein GCM10009769_04480 [Curtobacterium luteum]
MTVPLAVHLFDAASILHGFGPWVLGGIALLVVVESGVLFPFLPDVRVGRRFVPVVRTFVPLAAGTARMRFAGSMTRNIVGALVRTRRTTGAGR